MAQLDVQPKKKSPIWPWILAGLGILLLFFLLTRDRSDTDEERTPVAANRADSAASPGTKASDEWDRIDFNSPNASYEEVSDKDVKVRGGNGYVIYSVDEQILFDTDKSALRKEAEKKLKNISASLEKRYKDKKLRVYGYTDAEGSAGYNQQLAEQRAEAVRDWLISNGNINKDHISVHPVGEARPVASNDSQEGRQQNRRVDIVVMSQ